MSDLNGVCVRATVNDADVDWVNIYRQQCSQPSQGLDILYRKYIIHINRWERNSITSQRTSLILSHFFFVHISNPIECVLNE